MQIKVLKYFKKHYYKYIICILGNHDYGDYVSWETPQAKIDNLQNLINTQRSMGWNVLLDENITLEQNGEQISLIGIQNWGAKARFPSAVQHLEPEDQFRPLETYAFLDRMRCSRKLICVDKAHSSERPLRHRACEAALCSSPRRQKISFHRSRLQGPQSY